MDDLKKIELTEQEWNQLKEKSKDEIIDLLENRVETESRVFFFEAPREIFVHNPDQDLLEKVSQVAHLESSSGNNFKFKVRDMDVWNSDLELEEIEQVFYDLFEQDYPNFNEWLQRIYERQFIFSIDREDQRYVLKSSDPERMEWARSLDKVRDNLPVDLDDNKSIISPGSSSRATVKRELIKKGYPVQDEYKFKRVDKDIDVDLMVDLRDYQQDQLEKSWRKKACILANPSGSGKTVTAIGLISKANSPTLILVPQRSLISQWKSEILDKTDATEDKIGEYHGDKKQMNDITIATYHIAGRNTKLFRRDWGLIIFDETHHIPSNLFRKTATLQSTRRLGLSATPVREDSREKDIYALIGPEIGGDWARFFAGGWVLKPEVEILFVGWESKFFRNQYKEASGIQKNILAGKNPAKEPELERILDKKQDKKKIIFCDWIDQGKKLSREFDLPFIYGETDHEKREEILDRFRDNAEELNTLIVSRIGDEGIDLPEAEVGVVMSGQGGSRRQATQRTGRVMRPFGSAKIYFIATKGTNEEDFVKRQMELLKEKGIEVNITDKA